jgi:membrane protein
LGGIVVLLLWMWISSLALMLGAEINAVLTRRPSGV